MIALWFRVFSLSGFTGCRKGRYEAFGWKPPHLYGGRSASEIQKQIPFGNDRKKSNCEYETTGGPQAFLSVFAFFSIIPEGNLLLVFLHRMMRFSTGIGESQGLKAHFKIESFSAAC